MDFLFQYHIRGTNISEAMMKTKTQLLIILFPLICVTCRVLSQPYYYTNGTDTTKILRVNLQNGSSGLFYSDSLNPWGNVSWDPTQQWVFINRDNSYLGRSLGKDDYYTATTVVNANLSSIAHAFPNQFSHPVNTSPNSFYHGRILMLKPQVYDGVVYNPIANVFYVSWLLPYPDTIGSWTQVSAYQRTAMYNASTFTFLDTLSTPPGWITSLASVSVDGNYLYLEHWGISDAEAVGKYSLLTKQLIVSRNLSDIYVSGGNKGIDDSKKGRYLLEFLYPSASLADKKYAIYDIDQDTTYAVFSFPLVSKGYLSSDGKYIIIEETPLRPDYLTSTSGDDFLHPGRISIFDGSTGTLIQKLTLPPDGRVLVFDNYPNMMYYYIPRPGELSQC